MSQRMFPSLDLPLNQLKAEVRKMNVSELLIFSCQSHEHAVAVSTIPGVAIENPLFDLDFVPKRAVLTCIPDEGSSWDRWEIQFGHLKPESKVKARNMNGIEIVIIKRPRRIVKVLTRELTSEALAMFIRHMKNTFGGVRFRKLVFELNTSEFKCLEPVLPTIKECRDYFVSFQRKRLSEIEIDWVTRSIHATHKFEVCRNGKGSTYTKCCFQHVLKRRNCEVIILIDSLATLSDLETCVRQWYYSDARDLRMVKVLASNTTEEMNLEGLKPRKWQRFERSQHFLCPKDSVTERVVDCQHGTDIERPDGLLATVAIIGSAYFFVVWHERFHTISVRDRQ
ncbi:Protein CBG22224 [Caenorhabditis briggsae]|nr:Protein CBG22224 [Caenorhabditis briggsae]UMM10736.1 hypothetical protein L5515_000375 [Caenorhabditis briggsae]CAP38861.1 Protein CBG22224 [Caenorhabditis briggsae]